MICLFISFACDDSKKLPSHFCGASFQFYAEKCPQDVEDTEVNELCGSAPPHPVRCPPISSRVKKENGCKYLLLNKQIGDLPLF